MHTDVGHRCRGAKVDGRIVPLDHVLRSGDRVEILTGKVAEPRRDWLVAANGFLASARSREKVRSWFHKLDRARNLQAGRELLDRELKRLGLAQADLHAGAGEVQRLDRRRPRACWSRWATSVRTRSARALLEHERAQAEPAARASARRRRAHRRRQARRTSPSKASATCWRSPRAAASRCRAKPIVGYLTRGRACRCIGAGCATFVRLAAAQPQRALPVEWGARGGGYEVDAVVMALDRKWLLKDLTNLIAQEGAHVSGIHSEAGRARHACACACGCGSTISGSCRPCCGKLAAMPGVEEARRAT